MDAAAVVVVLQSDMTAQVLVRRIGVVGHGHAVDEDAHPVADDVDLVGEPGIRRYERPFLAMNDAAAGTGDEDTPGAVRIARRRRVNLRLVPTRTHVLRRAEVQSAVAAVADHHLGAKLEVDVVAALGVQAIERAAAAGDGPVFDGPVARAAAGSLPAR